MIGRARSIIQQRNGQATIVLAGRWIALPNTRVLGIDVRLVSEDTNVPPAMHLEWSPVDARPDGTWSAVLKDVPAGGLYRLETHLRVAEAPQIEWSHRGDTRHFIGVGDVWINRDEHHNRM